jgi:putative phosphoesterase
MTQLESLSGTRFGVIADAHIHPGKTPPFPAGLSDAFRGVHGIIALGDMGEPSSLDALERIAPVYAVRGEDDSNQDSRSGREVRSFTVGTVTVGAVFDAVKHGLFDSSDPVSVRPDLEELLRKCFGHSVDVLLCASTHKPLIASSGGVLIVNPGSPTLADKRTVAILVIVDGAARSEHVEV